jgi:hypothetical protein
MGLTVGTLEHTFLCFWEDKRIEYEILIHLMSLLRYIKRNRAGGRGNGVVITIEKQKLCKGATEVMSTIQIMIFSDMTPYSLVERQWRFSETLIPLYHTTRRHVPENNSHPKFRIILPGSQLKKIMVIGELKQTRIGWVNKTPEHNKLC